MQLWVVGSRQEGRGRTGAIITLSRYLTSHGLPGGEDEEGGEEKCKAGGYFPGNIMSYDSEEIIYCVQERDNQEGRITLDQLADIYRIYEASKGEGSMVCKQP